jgi:hypothetical protein
MFIFLLIILALVGVGFIFRKMKRIFSVKSEFTPSQERMKKDDNVIYKKDDVVVLKGEADLTKRKYDE